ncbi:MAG TPA: sortase [Chloroflexota bacterium]|nr:sortase [Chloroflexota bacterium]
MTRRRFVLLSTVALIGAACASPAETGLRGSGTVLRPRETPEASQPYGPAQEPTAIVSGLPTLVPTPMIESEPIVATDALPTAPGGSTDAEMHVVPVLSGKPPIVSTLPARRVIIPTIGLDTKVIQLGTKLDRRGQIAWETAPFAVGQHKGLAGPGQNGNMILSGHISSPNEGSIFHHLPDLQVGQGVIVGTDERQYLYRVVDVKTVTPDQIEVLDQTPDPTATLITCVPDGIYSHRLVVTARLV